MKEIIGGMISETSEAENKAIDQAVAYAHEIAQSYGATRAVDDEKIFILHEGSVEKMTNGNLRNGFYHTRTQSAFVDRTRSFSIALTRVVHECLHLTSFQAAKIYKDGSDMPYRSGIELITLDDGVRKNFFAAAQEAIIAELTYRYFNEVIRHDPTFTKQVMKTDSVKKWLMEYSSSEKNKEIIGNILIIPEIDDLYTKIENPDKDEDEIFDEFMHLYNSKLKDLEFERERLEERKRFDSVLDNIVERSNGKISDRSSLFDQFARAHFTGNYLPLARLVEETLGKGSFREIAEKLAKV
jgi:hypothetical protein